MDYERLAYCCRERSKREMEDATQITLEEAATALSTLRAENAQLRADLEYEREHANAYYEECGQWEAENEKLRAELEQIKAERDMAVEDFRRIGSEGLCSVCGNLNAPDLYCADCKGTAHIVTDMFEWRGIKED